MDFTFRFITEFLRITSMAFPLLAILMSLFMILGQIVGRIEGWTKFNALYWSFITALTVGYGDIRPLTKISKLISIAIGLIGIMFTGLLVGITVYTADVTLGTNPDVAKETVEMRQ